MVKPLNSSSNIVFKKTNTLPNDDHSVGLAWFSSKVTSPANNLSITDLSGFIPENAYNTEINSNPKIARSKLVFANELGILENENGNTIFDCDDVSISDVFLNQPTLDKKYTIAEINNKAFAHSYYISRYYTMLPVDYFLIDDLDSFIEENKIPKSIRVLDENGQEYIDANTGLKKYRILLDQVREQIYENRSNRPYKIIVFFSDPNPINLQLVYDRVALSSTESISSVIPQYKENINTVSIFNKVFEESIAVDNSMRNKKIFSKKSITFKNNIIGNNSSADGFEIVVPKKATSDNRTYETFNWRLITKILKKVDVSSVNGEEEIDSESNIKQKVVNCAVLCTTAQLSEMTSSGNYSSANPYVFYRLQQSPYNLSRYSYVNPIGSGTNNFAIYWLVSIDQVTNDQLSSFDILAWSPVSAITQEQGQKIKYFVENTQGTIILDLSGASGGAENVDASLSISSTSYPLNSWSYNTSNVFLDEKKNGAWPISASIFKNVNINSVNHDIYSIFGRNNIGSLSLGLTNYKTVKEFTGSYSQSNIVLKNSRGNPLFVGFSYVNTTDALVKGNILATTCSFLKYCSDIYQPSAVFDIAMANSNNVSINQDPFVATSAVERTV
jgi:hypothetical protein